MTHSTTEVSASSASSASSINHKSSSISSGSIRSHLIVMIITSIVCWSLFSYSGNYYSSPKTSCPSSSSSSSTVIDQQQQAPSTTSVLPTTTTRIPAPTSVVTPISSSTVTKHPSFEYATRSTVTARDVRSELLLVGGTSEKVPGVEGIDYYYPKKEGKNNNDDGGGACYMKANKVKSLWLPTRCLDEGPWIERWVRERSQADSSWTIVNVGANKGYVVSEILQALFGASNPIVEKYNTVNLVASLLNATNNDIKIAAGACSCTDCAREPTDFSSIEEREKYAAKSARVVMFEPVFETFNFLTKFFDSPPQQEQEKISSSSSQKIQFDIRLGAVGAQDGTLKFRSGPSFHETGFVSEKLKKLSPKEIALISAMKLDTALLLSSSNNTSSNENTNNNNNIVPNPGNVQYKVGLRNYSPQKQQKLQQQTQKLSYDMIDILLTDTEGHDVAVEYGARNLLSAGRVKLYVFELHAKKINFNHVYQELHEWGFDCYFRPEPSQYRWSRVDKLPLLVRITGSCSSPAFGDVRGWMNVACVNSRAAPELAKIFAEMTKEMQLTAASCVLEHQVRFAWKKCQEIQDRENNKKKKKK